VDLADRIWKRADALSLETARTERLRALILAVLFSTAAVLFMLVSSLLPEAYLRILRSNELRQSIVVLFLAVAAYEFAISFGFRFLSRMGRRLPEPARYLNTVVEITVPSVGIYLFSDAVHSSLALVSPFYAMYFLFIIVSTLRLSVALSLLSGALAAAEYLALGLYLTVTSETNEAIALLNAPGLLFARSMLLLGGGVAAAVIARQIKRRIGRMLRSMDERTALIQLFGQQVSEPVANELLRHPDHARGVTRELTVMFVDIRDFTPFAERHSAEEVVEYLNRLFDRMIAVIDRHGGIINQFLGDGFMTTFGAPVPMDDHARRAILAAVELDDIVARMSRDGEIPSTRIGIGLHSGEAVTGNIGAASRRQYSITGAAVIIASRIEQLNKEYASSVLASAETWRRAGLEDNDHWDAVVSLGAVRVKGWADDIEVFRLR